MPASKVIIKFRQHWAEWKKEIDSEKVTGQMLYRRLDETCDREWTYMHYVCMYGYYKDFQKVVQPLTREQKFKIFKKQTKHSQSTPLLKMMSNERLCGISKVGKCLQMALCSLSHDEKLSVVRTLSRSGTTVITTAAKRKRALAIETLMAMFKHDPNQQLNLMKVTWRYKDTGSIMNTESGYSSEEGTEDKKPSLPESPVAMARYRGHQNCVQVLESLRVDAMVASIVELLDMSEQGNCRELNKRLDEVIQHEPITPKQVEKLSSQLNKYILPQNQTISKRQGLVFYSTDCREGAEVEAERMKDSLEMLDHEVHTVQWTNAQSFRDEYSNHLERIKSNCCFLTLCIMAHGSTGTVRGSDGSAVPVNHILYELTHTLPTHVPVVIIIQACQQSSPAISVTNTDARIGSSENNTFIDLKRPHTLLFISTVAGGTALRGAYTGALARQFRMADGKTSIQDMHCKAVQQMNGGYQWQVAESRCTLIRGSLVLPRPTCTSH